jgi:hypothetical protein
VLNAGWASAITAVTPTNLGDIGTEKVYVSISRADGYSMAIYISVPKGAGVTEDLLCNYSLKTPIATPLETSGLLTSEPSGKVYRQPAVEDSGMYDAGIVVSDSEHPIDTLESLAIYDFETGLETDLDVSTAVIASGGLSFTHAGLTDGDIVTYRYLHADAYPVGESTVTHFDSRYVKIDSVTGKAYKWDLSVADGVASIGLTEVV